MKKQIYPTVIKDIESALLRLKEEYPLTNLEICAIQMLMLKTIYEKVEKIEKMSELSLKYK